MGTESWQHGIFLRIFVVVVVCLNFGLDCFFPFEVILILHPRGKKKATKLYNYQGSVVLHL